MIVDRVTRFLTSPQNEPFEELALAAFAWQFERVEPFRRLCERRGVSPATVTGWRQVPPVPTAALKHASVTASHDPSRALPPTDTVSPAVDSRH